ncbi:MAG: Y-family DNA polymerase, partial [Patescibacteria group bacterium]
ALSPCNNFFVSCEKIFRPDLEGKPVVVLSSNDGCVVARSNEVRALGIPMAAPVFKYQDLFKKHNIIKFSANFELYGDISKRIVSLLSSITPRIEVYSVDESFLDLSQLAIKDYEAWGKAVRVGILKWVGVPVSIGIAPTKSLAKLASERGKKDAEKDGVCVCLDKEYQDSALQKTYISDVWGVGWRGAPKWRAEGVSNALELAQVSPQRAQQLMGIRGRQMITELNGTSCYRLEPEGHISKSIARTRTFGEDTSDAHIIEAALATFCARASFVLRREHQLTKRVGFFITTNKHKPGYTSWSREVKLSVPTADTGTLLGEVMSLFTDVYSPNRSYHRAGVFLYDFVPSNVLQTDLLGVFNTQKFDKITARLKAIDHLNNKYGRHAVHLAAEDLGKTWQPKYHLRSPRYVSNWSELPIVKIPRNNNTKVI